MPKSRGGRSTVPVHPICHRTLHVHLTNVELAKIGDDPAALRERPDLARFVRWVGQAARLPRADPAETLG